MWSNNMLYLVFIAQIFFISFYFPMRLIKEALSITERYPPEEYPKLYPVSKEVFLIGINTYRNLNIAVVVIGLAIVIHGLYSQTQEMLNLDSQVVIFAFFMLQWMPLLLLEFSGLKYLKLMRITNTESTRTAALKPRNVLDYVSPVGLVFTIAMQLGLVILVIYLSFNPFDGFGGMANLLGLFFADSIFIGVLLWNVKGKKKNPYMSSEDRDKQIKKLVKILITTSNVMIGFLAIDLILSATESRYLLDIFMSLYFVIIGAVSFQGYQADGGNYEVYRDKSASSS